MNIELNQNTNEKTYSKQGNCTLCIELTIRIPTNTNILCVMLRAF